MKGDIASTSSSAIQMLGGQCIYAIYDNVAWQDWFTNKRHVHCYYVRRHFHATTVPKTVSHNIVLYDLTLLLSCKKTVFCKFTSKFVQLNLLKE